MLFGPDFLLRSETARQLYHAYCEDLPIIDFHCHLSPADIAGDRRWGDMAELWLAGDHYKWRALRAHGVAEYYVTGGAAPYEKFEKYAALLPLLAGNPLFHWSNMELARYFGVGEPLSAAACRKIWDVCGERLSSLSARSIIKDSKVRLIYTTDDPADDLRHHRALRGWDVAVLPAWRPDRALNIGGPGFGDYIRRLGEDIRDLDGLKAELVRRMDGFAALGCRNSDHGLDRIPLETGGSPEAAFKKALSGAAVSEAEAEGYKAELLGFLAREYARRGWVMQLHVGAARNVNPPQFAALGPDSGFDAIGGEPSLGARLAAFLGSMEASGRLPKTLVYSLNPADNAQLCAACGCFQAAGIRGKVQQGAAWWFNDTKRGLEEQLSSLASLSVLADFVGMTTDSRSFLSYVRHDYFRRVLCSLLGGWVENGEYPRDMEALGKIVRGVSYFNAAEYFGA